MIKAGIVGISGYSGRETLRLLLTHPDVRVTYVGANTTTGRVTDIWPCLSGQTDLVCKKYAVADAVEHCDVIFLALPHQVAMSIAPELLKAGKKIIDLSGDYRLATAADYEKWYGAAHTDPRNLTKAVYGLPEFYRTEIKGATLLANPGCYPTAALLALGPLASLQNDAIQSIIIDAKSGVTGAGKKTSDTLMFCEVNENFKAYKVLKHQHMPEIERYLARIAGKKKGWGVTFVPHLLPVNRGILETIYVSLTKKMTLQTLHTAYARFYKTEPFVRVRALGEQPELKNVVGTNYCDIGLALSEDRTLLVITSTIDNLLKGAAGQAVQNMNIMCGFKETTGLL